MFRKISIISSFNIENFNNLFKIFQKSLIVKTFSNSSILNDLPKNKNNNLIIIIIDQNKSTEIFKKFLLNHVIKNKNSFFFFIEIPFIHNKISAPIIKPQKFYSISRNYKGLIKLNNFLVIDYNQLANKFNQQIFNFKRWFQTKIPFTINFENFLAEELYNLLSLENGKRKKAIFFDLDDTIWGGTLADDGQNKLLVGGISSLGEAFLSFQKTLIEYQKSGIMLGIISRNDEKSALKAVDSIPNMQIRKKDLAGWRINFENKSKNIKNLSNELRINPDSIIFIDNSIYEREEVKQKIPEIIVPEISDGSPYEFSEILGRVNGLNYIKLNKEDIIRNQSIQNLKKVNISKANFSNHNEWLKSLNIKLIFEKFNKKNIERIHQMYQRINQMNLSTRRLTLAQIQKENKNKTFNLITLSVMDSIADLGMIALISYEIRKKEVIIKDFLFSCRALGRDIELFLINFLVYNLQKKGFKKFIFNFKKTKKNNLCYNLLKKIKTKTQGKLIVYNRNLKNKKNNIFKLIFKDKIF
jgi:FkbH-like protein